MSPTLVTSSKVSLTGHLDKLTTVAHMEQSAAATLGEQFKGDSRTECESDHLMCTCVVMFTCYYDAGGNM